VDKVVHPTFLYEMLWSLAVVVLLVIVDRRYAIGHGRLFALYVAGYCAGRFWVELLRDDYATEIAGIRINTFTAGIVFVLAVVYIVLAKKGREDPETLRSNDDVRETEDSVDTESVEGDSVDTDSVDTEAVDTEAVGSNVVNGTPGAADPDEKSKRNEEHT
jgi:hypothetical protein